MVLAAERRPVREPEENQELDDTLVGALRLWRQGIISHRALKDVIEGRPEGSPVPRSTMLDLYGLFQTHIMELPMSSSERLNLVRKGDDKILRAFTRALDHVNATLWHRFVCQDYYEDLILNTLVDVALRSDQTASITSMKPALRVALADRIDAAVSQHVLIHAGGDDGDPSYFSVDLGALYPDPNINVTIAAQNVLDRMSEVGLEELQERKGTLIDVFERAAASDPELLSEMSNDEFSKVFSRQMTQTFMGVDKEHARPKKRHPRGRG